MIVNLIVSVFNLNLVLVITNLIPKTIIIITTTTTAITIISLKF